ncbi:MAG: hypothetical protein DRJ41_02930 [Thermoprotei archaeon]|nr:MAG: hypothetical protein DRJ41_02930 [Thermoprotei archaeon]
MIKILHTADNHLDPSLAMFRHKIMERKMDFWLSFKKVLEYAEKAKPHIMLISGDLYDRVNPRNPPRVNILKAFRHLSNIGVKVLLIGGHHDTPRSVEEGASPLEELAASGHAVYLSGVKKPSYEHIKVGDVDVCVMGLTFNFWVNAGEDPLENVTFKQEGDFNILMLHYPIEDFTSTYRSGDPVVKLSRIPKWVDYVAAGHLHRYQKARKGGTLIVYPGSTERKSFLEEKDEVKGFVWIEVDSPGLKDLKLRFIEVPTRKMMTLTYSLSPSSKTPISDVVSYARRNADRNAILRLKVTGKVSLDVLTRYRREAVIRSLMDSFFTVILDDRDLRYEAERVEIAERLTPLTAFREYMDKLIEKESDPERREILEIAKDVGLRRLEEAGAW